MEVTPGGGVRRGTGWDCLTGAELLFGTMTVLETAGGDDCPTDQVGPSREALSLQASMVISADRRCGAV